TLNVTTNIRLPVHPDAEDLVGGFASFALQEIDLREPVGIAELARRMQQQNWQDLEHRYVNGVEILRELTRHQGGTTGSAAPIVFTSTLIDDGDADRESMVDWLGTPVYEIVQTPQVWLDVAVLELAGGLG